MSRWSDAELDRIGQADELEVSPLRTDGSTRRSTPIWVVRVGDDLYVRSWRGRDGAWFRAATTRGRGRISAGDVTKDVAFASVEDSATNDAIDAGYREKYAGDPSYVGPMLAEQARSTTLRLVPTEEQR